MPRWQHISCGGIYDHKPGPPWECPGCLGLKGWRRIGPSSSKGRVRRAELRGAQRNAKYRMLIARDGEHCQVCGTKVGLTVDHIQPRAHGGTNVNENLQLLCHECNQEKGHQWPWDLAAARLRFQLTGRRRSSS